MLAFHGSESLKERYLDRVERHKQADSIMQGYGYWTDGKGCAVGCTIHSAEHRDYETKLGVPAQIAHLEDQLFEEMSKQDAREWPGRFLEAIPVGADLSKVWARFAIWMIRDSYFRGYECAERERMIELHVAALGGVTSTSKEVDEVRMMLKRSSTYASEAVLGSALAYTSPSMVKTSVHGALISHSNETWVTENSVRMYRAEMMSDKLIELLKETCPSRHKMQRVSQ